MVRCTFLSGLEGRRVRQEENWSTRLQEVVTRGLESVTSWPGDRREVRRWPRRFVRRRGAAGRSRGEEVRARASLEMACRVAREGEDREGIRQSIRETREGRVGEESCREGDSARGRSLTSKSLSRPLRDHSHASRS